MEELTIFIKEVIDRETIQLVEKTLANNNSIERVLTDTSDGEVKVIYNEEEITPEEIKSIVTQRGLRLL